MMNFPNHAWLLGTIEGLRRHGALPTRTLVQKTVFMSRLDKTLEVPFRFLLYKNGPYTPDIDLELELMKTYEAVVSDWRPTEGVYLLPGYNSAFVKSKAPLSQGVERTLDRIAHIMAAKAKDPTQVELLSTAAWVKNDENVYEISQMSERLRALKPYLSVAGALQVCKELVALFPDPQMIRAAELGTLRTHN